MTSSGTAAGTVTLLLSIMLGLISVRASNPWLLLIACALLVPVMISRVLRPDLRLMAVCFQSEARVSVGGSVAQSFHVHNRGRRSSPPLQLGHRVRGFAPVTLAVPALPPGGKADLTISRPAVNRGVAQIHEVRLWTAAPFGLALHQSHYSFAVRISVHPAPGPVAVLLSASQGAGGGRPNRQGDEPHELREWRHGDSLRHVHWRATARHDRLTVVIPENAVRSRLALVIHDSNDQEFETLLSAAAWTAVEAVRSDGILRLSAAGSLDYLGDDPGAVFDWFAAIEPSIEAGTELVSAATAWAGPSGSVIIASTRPAAIAEQFHGLLVMAPDGRVSRS